MAENMSLHFTKLKSQAGVVLIVSLILLSLLTLIVVTGMQVTGLEEKMAGNMNDRNDAFQAAESALRDAERDLQSMIIPGTNPSTRQDPISGLSGFVQDCGKSTATVADDGLCYNGVAAKKTNPYAGYPVSSPIWKSQSMVAAPSVPYGTFTGAKKISNLSAQPRYLIEGWQSAGLPYYRITVRAQGVNANTVVWLQEIFKPL